MREKDKFNHNYFPLLRTKAGELWALGNLSQSDRNLVNPIFEVVPDIFKKKRSPEKAPENLLFPDTWGSQTSKCPAGVLAEWSKRIAVACALSRPATIDCRLLNGEDFSIGGEHPLRPLSYQIYDLGCDVIPVTSIKMPAALNAAVAKVVKKVGAGICLRVDLESLKDPQLFDMLKPLLLDLDVKEREVDLVIDLGSIENSTPPSLSSLLAKIPAPAGWRNITVLAGSFPKDLSGFDANTENELPRKEWCWYEQEILSLVSERAPSFGDYTIQHGQYLKPREGVPNTSASLRYTSDDHWVIMRGEGIRNKNGPGMDGYVGNAKMLVERDEWCHREFSIGDEFISDIASQNEKTGSIGNWVAATLNHHLVFAARQVQAFHVGVTEVERPIPSSTIRTTKSAKRSDILEH